MPKSTTKQKTFMIFTNVENHFYNHLLPIANEAKRRGYNVQVMTNFEKLESKIKALGFNTFDIKFSRKNLNPFLALKEIFYIYKTLRTARPDALMAFTIKPIFFSTIATIFLRKIRLFNNFVGLGLLFTDKNLKYRILRWIVSKALAIASIGRKIIYITQNHDDKLEIIKSRIVKDTNVIAQCSVGVDLNHFRPIPLPKSKTICFALISRMLVEKGVYEYIEAAKIIKNKGYKARFLLVGSPDEDNPKSLNKEFLEQLNKEAIVEYLGSTDDVRKIWDIAHVAVLPSYREGQSRVLLEAGAIGRAIITTDAPGGRDLINHGVDGLLCSVKNSHDLAEKIELLLKNPSLIQEFSHQINLKVLKYYQHHDIASKTIDIVNRQSQYSKEINH